MTRGLRRKELDILLDSLQHSHAQNIPCTPILCSTCNMLLCYRRVDVSPLMSPVQLAEQAVDLNLKLMRWRAAPGLDIDRMAATRCLLLGEHEEAWCTVVPAAVRLGAVLVDMCVCSVQYAWQQHGTAG
jgi:hypothetical protein